MKDALVLVSIVLGVAITFELEHLNKVLRSPKVRWHWAQPLFGLFVLLSIISFWWSAAANSEGELSFARFLPVMFQLVMLALLAAVSFPDKIPEEGLDLAEYYQESRIYQWVLINLYFWSIHIIYMIYVASRTDSFQKFAWQVAPDTIGALVLLAMIFLKKWWQIAIGFALLSIAPLVWLDDRLSRQRFS